MWNFITIYHCPSWPLAWIWYTWLQYYLQKHSKVVIQNTRQLRIKNREEINGFSRPPMFASSFGSYNCLRLISMYMYHTCACTFTCTCIIACEWEMNAMPIPSRYQKSVRRPFGKTADSTCHPIAQWTLLVIAAPNIN